ncbi:MAG: DUF4239 domain-containing protein [Acidobacteria bacterium]|nr:DUF4239 domain-containing protein [Acidobacteriota bacterium]
MLRWLLNHFDSAVLILLTAGVTIGIALGAEAWQRTRMKDRERRSNEMLSMTVEFVGIAYAILIGFVIVSLWETQGAASDTVSNEAAALSDIVTLTRGTDAADAVRIKTAVAEYSSEVAHHEFKLLRTGKASAKADADADAVFSAIVAADSSTPLHQTLQDKQIDSYKEFTALRTRRLQIANDKLAGELWLLVLVSSVALILLVAAFEGEGRWDVFASVVIAGTVGLVLFAMVALSYPFSGQVSVSPEPFIALAQSIG